MNGSSQISTNGIDSLEVWWEDGERVFCRERRPDANGRVNDVLIVTCAAEHPTPASLDRLAHEYALKDELDGPWAVRPLALIRERDRTMLVLEDSASEPLNRLLGTPMELGRFLHLAIAIAAALIQLHRRGLVHKDLKPTNILVNAARDAVRFTGFGIASRLSRERQAFEPPETIAGTLAYMAPEQTGRMNRSIDSRSDLYAIGVTLYEMLTGALPFTAAGPMEWVHCHVARRAIPPAERVKEVPGAVSAIIMKLLAKTAEERYQTAAGLKSDLQRCLAAWEAQGRIDYFRLGEDDKPDRLLIPEKLYGREREIESLLGSFDRVGLSSTPGLVLVSGYSGIGKSALVQELHTALVSSGGLFASGKFDQHKRDIPYATLAQAFQSLIRHLLAKSDAELAPWRDALREALDSLGRLIVDLVPELQLIIGDQPPVPEASPQDAQRRFQLVVRRFIAVFAQPDHPLTLFLDDLQWLDTATLDLLEDLLTRSGLRHLLLIGAYRHNEVDASHPLTRKLEVIRRAGARVHEISLAPLTRECVEQFTADTLRCELAHAAPLAQLMHEKTDGNPFFLIQFLYALAEQELLTFDQDKAQWCWDLGRIHAKGYTENVADLMIAKLNGLPDEARRALLRLACLGNSAEVTTLCLVHGVSEQQVHADLREAVRLELIERLDSSYKFVHDRVQEAAYALQPAEDKPALHLRIGMALAAHAKPDETGEKLYVIANQLNRGAGAVTSEAQRERIVAVNLAAGRRARAATAYNAAIAYLEVARELLGNEAHPSCSPTAFAVALLRAECELLVGQQDVAEAQLLVLSQSCRNVQAKAEVTRLRAYLYTARGQLERSIDVCLEFLRQVGIDWSPHPSDRQVDEERNCLRRLAEDLSDDQLHALPPMTDPGHRATMAVFADLVTPALLTDRNLCDIMLLAAARLTLQHGICEAACYPIVCMFGVLASNHADAELGFRLVQFGVVLADRQPQLGISGRALLIFGLHVTPWIRPIRSGQPFMHRSLEVSLAAGDLAFAAYSHRGLVSVRLFCGDPLQEVCRDAERGLTFFSQNSGFDLLAEFLTVQRSSALSLMGRDEENSFEVPSPTGPYPHEGTWPLSAFFYYTAHIQINVLAGRHDIALAVAERVDKLYWAARAYHEVVEFRFYTGLAQAAAYDAAPPERRAMLLSGLRQQHRKLSIWCARISENFVARQALIAAEIARIEGRELEAERLYEESIRLAREAGFVQIEAIASERAARFYEARGIQTVVVSYLANARDCYLRWGADAKVRQLDEMYPHLRKKEPVVSPTSTIGTPTEYLDLVTVLKVSEAVSGEIVLEKLIDTLLRTAVEHAGAERGLLVLPQGSELRIQASATTGRASITIDPRDSPISGAELPESLVLYAARTQESVILDDASARGAFTSDEYIRRKHARSVLCLPLIKQGKSVALLYLENNLAPHVFTPARVAVLKFLASEAATSLDNARLYRALQERESRIHRLVDANIIGICIFGPEGHIVDANHSFLKTVGYDREDLNTGRLRWTNLTPPEWSDRNALAHAELAATGAIQPFEKEYFRKDGNRAPILIGAAAFNKEQAVAFVLDLSERKRAEAEARESERRYREAQMELAHANRVAVMGQLTASIAHEVNQPTTAVVASAQAALRWLDRRPPELEQVRQALGRIVQNGMRASEVIERIHDLIKKKPPRKDSLAINAIIGEVIELTQAEAARNNVSVQTAFTDGLPEVVGDRVELQQVAANLILNAIEAMSGTTEGPRELLIRTAMADCDGVLVAVIDSGPGLLPASLERLFEPFYTTKPDGLGIGLSICRSIIEAHGGRLWVNANLPRGAIFQFTVAAKGSGSN
ncbi:AAA family ATPase [Bradyrhizobium canariense]|uniref:histidine kinase n=1 Tax=Bradyrhizobium canariense TaxID=255045 RepID=A0A1H1T0H9_9BRAD|nr:AAA family ATPase [Bradyrhizobium canariense]SDS53730.1 serine/threonine protein kinase and signal transduction histidine kinase with GAF sensor [Bradyrhizobium canariense]